MKPNPVAILKDNHVVGLANFMLSGKFGFKTMTIPKFFQYYGPILFDSDIGLYDAVEKYLKQNTNLAIFSLTPEFSNQFKSGLWKKYDRLTYYMKPDTIENLRNNCFDDVKNKLNKAAKSGVDIKTIDEFPYDIYRATFERRNLNPPIPKSQLVLWVTRLAQAGLAKTYAAYKSDKLMAFRTQLIANGYAYDWLAGSLPDANSLGVNQLLVLTIGQELLKAHVINWDLLGGDIKSIGDFKRSFGSIERRHLQIERAFSSKGKIYRSLMNLKGSGNV